MHYLASDYYSGVIVEKDTELAKKWCLKSATAGNAWAQEYIAFQFCWREPEIAAKWHELAAEQGNARGLRSMAMAYESGRGVPKDKVKAYAFYSLFDKCWEDEGRVGFKNKMELKRQLTPDQIEAGKKFARQFAAKFSV